MDKFSTYIGKTYYCFTKLRLTGTGMFPKLIGINYYLKKGVCYLVSV